MLVATLEDLQGSVEVVVFPRVFEETGPSWIDDSVVLVTGRIEACEALARWVRPNGAVINPGRFIPIAEESGLIHPLSDAIMRDACWKAAACPRTTRRIFSAPLPRGIRRTSARRSTRGCWRARSA